MTRTINRDALEVLSVAMAINGDVPCNVGGWRNVQDFDGPATCFGSVGELKETYLGLAVCVVAGSNDARCLLGNQHPDYRPGRASVWAVIPSPDDIDWRYIREEYHSPARQVRVR